MNRQIFAYLPSEITVDILSRLSVRDVAICKCVCKQWLHLLQTRYFVNLHLSKSVPGLVMYQVGGNINVFKYNDKLVPITNRDCKSSTFIPPSCHYFLSVKGSVNGLILLREVDVCRSLYSVLHICNPITGEYITLPSEAKLEPTITSVVAYGFGVSKLTGQYKIVNISHDLLVRKIECHVYTLGTGSSWRSISPGPVLNYLGNLTGIFLNGNLHWLVKDEKSSSFFISCLDLESEIFSTFSPPHTLPVMKRRCGNIVALMDCLCIYGVSSNDAEAIDIWMMKEYGDEKSWSKEFVIMKIQIPNFEARLYGNVYPIMVIY